MVPVSSASPVGSPVRCRFSACGPTMAPSLAADERSLIRRRTPQSRKPSRAALRSRPSAMLDHGSTAGLVDPVGAATSAPITCGHDGAAGDLFTTARDALRPRRYGQRPQRDYLWPRRRGRRSGRDGQGRPRAATVRPAPITTTPRGSVQLQRCGRRPHYEVRGLSSVAAVRPVGWLRETAGCFGDDVLRGAWCRGPGPRLGRVRLRLCPRWPRRRSVGR